MWDTGTRAGLCGFVRGGPVFGTGRNGIQVVRADFCLCIFVLVSWFYRGWLQLVLGDGNGVGRVGVFLNIERDNLLGLRRRRGGLDDGERSFQEAAGRGGGIAEKVADGLKCEIDEVFGLFAKQERAVILSVRQGVLERQ